MSSKAFGTVPSVFILCLALSAIILPVLSAPARIGNTNPRIPNRLKSLFQPRAAANKCGGTGIYITNGGSRHTRITLASGNSAPITLPANFDGHVQRGGLLPATWVELNMVPGAADGDVSLEIGCDGPATVQASTISGGGKPPVFGFSKDIISKAPANAFFNPANPAGENLGGILTKSSRVLDATGTDKVINGNTLKYEQSVLSQSQVYLFGGAGTNQAIASDNCILITFY